ncbi:uncharacterized protein LOC143074890 [Mytilus galloprovincialis]|uniref:uncharacterized protein LOC143074890 n=1 Tax=Mytilus galloprovincialis TaxID=29158 RepID=UPI003F7BC5E8
MDKRVIITNLPTYVYGMGVDVNVERLYWMEYTGDLQFARYNGSDIRTIVSTKTSNRDIEVNEDFILYTSYNQVMKINKSLGQTPTVVHTDSQAINGILLYKQDGKSCDEK